MLTNRHESTNTTFIHKSFKKVKNKNYVKFNT